MAGRRSTLLLALLAVLVGVLVGGAPAHAASVPITSGAGLDWGLKASWRAYIGSAGTTVGDGATYDADAGTFHFPLVSGTYDPDTKRTIVQFRGTTQFLGHCDGGGFERPCALDMTMSDPRVELTEDGGVLFAKMTNRPITGGDVEDLPDVRVATLDLESASPTIAGGTTTWSGLQARMAGEGSTIFTYAVGTLLDPVSFGYAGPGGKPAGETWSTPALATYASQLLGPTAPDGPAVPVVQTVLPGAGDGAVAARGAGWIGVLDATTLTPEAPGSVVDATTVSRDTFAVDPATRTLFGVEDDGAKRVLRYTWDGTTLSGGPIAGSAGAGLSTDPSLKGAGTWDAVGQRYVFVREYADRQEAWQARLVSGAWTVSSIGVIRGGDGQPLLNRITSLAVAPGGSASKPAVLLAGVAWSDVPIQELTLGTDTATAAPFATADGFGADQLWRTADGVYAYGGGPVAYFPVEGAGSAAKLGAPKSVAFPSGTPPLDANRANSWMAVDPARNVLYAATTANTRIARIASGVLQHQFAVPGVDELGWWDHQLAGADAAGDLLLTSLSASTVHRLSFVSVTPSFTTQPQSATVQVRGEDAREDATFTVAVAGDPAPTVRWQSRVPGSEPWADLADGANVTGATTTTLRLRVGKQDAGREYRAIATNADGEVASDRVGVEVQTLPSAAVPPADVTAVVGTAAQFEVKPDGNPAPTVTWQRRVGGFWQDVDLQSGDVDVSGGFLTVKDVNEQQDGTEFRAKLVNAVGTTYTPAARLSVSAAVTGPVTIRGGDVDWGFAERWRCYVVGQIARGGIVTTGGISRNAGTLATGPLCSAGNAGSETLRFPVTGGSYDPGTQQLRVTLGGTVRFWGHAYHVPGDPTPLLNTTFSNLRVEGTGDSVSLYGDAVGTTMESSTPITHTGVPIVTVALHGTGPTVQDGRLVWTRAPTSLTTDGAAIFGSYAAGEPFDPLSLSLSTTPTTPPADPGDGTVQRVPPPAPLTQVTQIIQQITQVAGAPSRGPARPTIAPRAARQRLDARGRATIATVRCPTGTQACRLRTPTKVRVAVGRKRYDVRVSHVARVRAGGAAAIRVRLLAKDRRALRGRTVRVPVRVTAVLGTYAIARTIVGRVTVGGGR